MGLGTGSFQLFKGKAFKMYKYVPTSYVGLYCLLLQARQCGGKGWETVGRLLGRFL